MMRSVFNTVVKPGGSLCNLACEYCFYLKKTQLQKRTRAMTDEVLERYILRVIEETPSQEVLFCWQGGEPTLCGLSFYKKVLALQQRHAAGKTILNSLQTNGVLINDAWAVFFAQHHFLLGVSIDGPKIIHDRHRKTPSGNSSFALVADAIHILKKYEVDFNALTVVSHASASQGKEIYRCLTRDLEITHLQFIPAVECRMAGASVGEESSPPAPSPTPRLTPWSVTPEGWGEFMCAVFDEWVGQDVGSVFVQFFDNLLAAWMGDAAALCVMQPRCGQSLLVEKNGDVFSCDHFVYPSHRIGNVMQNSLEEMANSPFQRQFGAAKENLPARCLACAWRFACHGGCPKHRILIQNNQAQNYLCEGYRRIFQHITPYMNIMRQLLLDRRPAAHITRLAGIIADDVRQLQDQLQETRS